MLLPTPSEGDVLKEHQYLELARIGSLLFIFADSPNDQIGSSSTIDTFAIRLSAQPLNAPNKTFGHSASRSTRSRDRETLGECRPAARSEPLNADNGSAKRASSRPPTGTVPASRSIRCRAERCEGLCLSS